MGDDADARCGSLRAADDREAAPRAEQYGVGGDGIEGSFRGRRLRSVRGDPLVFSHLPHTENHGAGIRLVRLSQRRRGPESVGGQNRELGALVHAGRSRRSGSGRSHQDAQRFGRHHSLGIVCVRGRGDWLDVGFEGGDE